MYSKIGKPLFNLIFALTIVLSVSEILIRSFLPQKSNYRCIGSNFDIPNSLKPNCTIISNLYFDVFYKIKINPKGLRSNHAVSYKKPLNTFRILVLGDSIIFGIAVNNENLFSFVLEQNLNQQISNKKFEVINASAPGWGPIEYYLYMKNEGYKYSPDLVIINQSIDDAVLIPQDRVDFKNLKYQQTSQGIVQITFDKVFTRPQKTSVYKLIKQGITSLPFYETFLNDFHTFTFINNRLTQLGVEDKKAFVKKTALSQLFEILKKKNIKEVSWKIQGRKMKGPVSEKSQKRIQYYYIMNALTRLILKNDSQILFLNSPTYQEVFEIVKKTNYYNPITTNKNNSIQLVDGMISFYQKNATHLLFPKDLHWTPSGHYFSAVFVFNYLLRENLIPNLIHKNHEFDLNDPLLVNQIKAANDSLKKDLNKTPLWFFNKAMIYKIQNRNHLAIQTLKDYLSRYSNDKDGWYELGKLQSKENEKLKAVESFHKSLDHSREPSPKTLFLIGKNYFKLNQLDNSLKYLNKSSQYKHPILPEVYNYIAMISHRKKDFGSAEKYWKLAISENPDFSQYYRSLGNLYFDDQLYEKSLFEYKNSIKLNPRQARVLTLMGLAYAKLNKLEEATKVFSKALKFEPNNQIALSGLSFINIFKKK
jgi:tetratricopeptide (TPR) repeat protein